MSTTSINIQFTTTSSAVFTAPVQLVTILDSTNRNFLRQIFVSNDGVKLVATRNGNVVQIPVTQLFGAAGSANPSLTWPPVINVQPVSQSVVHPLPAAFSVSASAETAITYQWQAQPSGSSSFYNLPIPLQQNWTGSFTPNLTVSSSWYPNTFSLNGWNFRAVCSNTSGQATSSTAILNVS